MLYGIFSDVHSNLEALEEMLNFYKEQKIDFHLCCGDIVGYGPNPNECIEKLFLISSIAVVLGNHDAAVCDKMVLEWFNEEAQQTLLWTKQHLNEENKNYLRAFPLDRIINNFTIVHAAPRDQINEYILTLSQMLENLSFFSTQICFIGHSHIPFIFVIDKTRNFNLKIITGNEIIRLNNDSRYIINAGSVGQPRDGNNKLSCILYDEYNAELRFYRLEYDFSKTQEKMYAAGLPPYLIERLSWGR